MIKRLLKRLILWCLHGLASGLTEETSQEEIDRLYDQINKNQELFGVQKIFTKEKK